MLAKARPAAEAGGPDLTTSVFQRAYAEVLGQGEKYAGPGSNSTFRNSLAKTPDNALMGTKHGCRPEGTREPTNPRDMLEAREALA